MQNLLNLFCVVGHLKPIQFWFLLICCWKCLHCLLFFFFSPKVLFIYFESKGGRKRGRETDRLPLMYPQPGTWPATQAYALTGNRTGNLLVCGTTPNPLSHTSQVCSFFLSLFFLLGIFLGM